MAPFNAVIDINDISSYGGLIINNNNSNIRIDNINIKGSNSSLKDGAGWIAGEGFGIFGSWCVGTAKNCINVGSILGISTGGIFGEFSKGTSDNSVNYAKVDGVNSRAI